MHTVLGSKVWLHAGQITIFLYFIVLVVSSFLLVSWLGSSGVICLPVAVYLVLSFIMSNWMSFLTSKHNVSFFVLFVIIHKQYFISNLSCRTYKASWCFFVLACLRKLLRHILEPHIGHLFNGFSSSIRLDFLKCFLLLSP